MGAYSTRSTRRADRAGPSCSNGSTALRSPFRVKKHKRSSKHRWASPSIDRTGSGRSTTATTAPGQAKLLAFDLGTGGVVHEHLFDSSVAQLGSFLQDLQVDSKGKRVFIADVSFWRKNPGLIVYDVELRKARRVLNSDPSVSAQSWLIRNPSKDMTFFGGLVVLKPGVDGIAISRDDAWIYYGAMCHDTMYRVKVADLLDESLSDGALAARVQAIGPKPLNDGLSTDNDGNLLITDVEHGAVLRMKPDGELTTLVRSEKIRWADALSYGPDGWLYVADSAIPDQMLRSKAHMQAHAPYYIFRFKPGVDGIPGQ